MKSFYIITNKYKDPEGKHTRTIEKYLISKGAECICQIDSEGLESESSNYSNPDVVPENVDCVIVLGGDGTLIQAARDLCDRDIPLWGVNIGTLGYLTDSEMDRVFDNLDLLLQDKFDYDSRMMLEGAIFNNDSKVFSDMALNDVVISRNGALRLIYFDIYVNGEYLNSYSADGVIVSTATGSTAYSLSAGGPIIQPNARLIMITPVCPHSLNKRSIIFSSEDVISIVVTSKKNPVNKKSASEVADSIIATFDGESFYELKDGDRVEVKKNEKASRFIKTSKVSFLERIRNKM